MLKKIIIIKNYYYYYYYYFKNIDIDVETQEGAIM